jgi:putative FmdB family regulatory protein
VPLYEYLCRACGGRFEVIQKFSDPAPAQCAKCGKGPVDRQMSSPAIQFKGTGWYITDYAQKGKSGGDTSSGADGKAAAASSDGAGKSEAASTSDTAAKTESTPASTATKSSSET